MKFAIPSTALGLALIAAAPAAQAQTVITRGIADQPVDTIITQQPVQTVQTTTETIRTVRPAPRSARRQTVTTRTITRQVVPAPAIVARTVTTAPQPLYDEVAPAPIAETSQPLYDVVPPAPGPAIAATPVVQDYTQPFVYRYVYEPDRILVIDPSSGIAVQAIPR